LQALDIYERQLGVNHPNTVTIGENLAYFRVGVGTASRREARRRHRLTSQQQ